MSETLVWWITHSAWWLSGAGTTFALMGWLRTRPTPTVECPNCGDSRRVRDFPRHWKGCLV